MNILPYEIKRYIILLLPCTDYYNFSLVSKACRLSSSDLILRKDIRKCIELASKNWHLARDMLLAHKLDEKECMEIASYAPYWLVEWWKGDNKWSRILEFAVNYENLSVFEHIDLEELEKYPWLLSLILSCNKPNILTVLYNRDFNIELSTEDILRYSLPIVLWYYDRELLELNQYNLEIISNSEVLHWVYKQRPDLMQHLMHVVEFAITESKEGFVSEVMKLIPEWSSQIQSAIIRIVFGDMAFDEMLSDDMLPLLKLVDLNGYDLERFFKLAKDSDANKIANYIRSQMD